MSRQRYIPLQCLGQGAFGRVSLVHDTVENKHIVIKEPIRGEGNLKHERRMLERARGVVGIPKFLGMMEMQGKTCLMLGYIEGSSLQQLSGMFCLSVTSCMVSELISIIATLHSLGIAHQDIHERNVLIDTHNHIHIIDFGLAGTPSPDFLKRGFRSDINDVLHIAERLLAQTEKNHLHSLLLEWLRRRRKTVLTTSLPQLEAQHLLTDWYDLQNRISTIQMSTTYTSRASS